MKTIEQLIEERIITEKDGYSEGSVSLSLIRDIAIIYANQKLDEAAESAEMKYHCGHTKQNKPTKYHQVGADNLQVNKQSILNLKDEIL